MVYIFIDESGDLGLRGSKYLVLSALMVEDYSFLDRKIKVEGEKWITFTLILRRLLSTYICP